MYMSTCVRILVYVFICVCLHMYTYICLHVHFCVSVPGSVYVLCMFFLAQVDLWSLWLCAYVWMCKHALIFFVHVHFYVCPCLRPCMRMHGFLCVFRCVFMYLCVFVSGVLVHIDICLYLYFLHVYIHVFVCILCQILIEIILSGMCLACINEGNNASGIREVNSSWNHTISNEMTIMFRDGQCSKERIK